MRFPVVSVILMLDNTNWASPNCSALSWTAMKANCLMSPSNWTTILSSLFVCAFGPKTNSHVAKSAASSSSPQTYKRAPNADKLASNLSSTGDESSKLGDRRMKRGVVSSKWTNALSVIDWSDEWNLASLKLSWRFR